MRRRTYLRGFGTSLGALTVAGTAKASHGFTSIAYASDGLDPSNPGSVRIHVIGTANTTNAEVEECVSALDTALQDAYQVQQNGGVGIRGYTVWGWQSAETFPHSDGCGASGQSAMEYSAQKLAGSSLDGSPSIVNWLWDHQASWSAGRGMGEPWGDDPSHQHPTFTDNTGSDLTKLAFSCVHEVGHALVYTGHGDAWCDPPSFDTQSYEGCSEAAALSAPWYRYHRDHTLGGVLDDGGTLRRTPMAHQGEGYLLGSCQHNQTVPYNWTYHLSDCTIEAMGHSWRHLENWNGAHGNEDVDGPDPIDENSFNTYQGSGTVVLTWDGVSDNGSAGLEYYGVEVREYDSNDPQGGRLVPSATQTTSFNDPYVTFTSLDPNAQYTVHVTPVDRHGNVPDTDPRARQVIQT